MRFQILKHIILVCITSAYFSCETEVDISPTLVTEDVLYLSGEQVRLLGRVITNQEIDATDHGFYFAENENFSSPIILSLGPKQSPGKFIGEYNGLDSEKIYYAKAFINVPAGLIFGNTISFQTLSTNILGISPDNGRPGTLVDITGTNFTEDSKVFFGEREAEIVSLTFESRIRVKVPPSGSNQKESIRVISQNKEVLYSGFFEYTSGIYEKVPMTFPLTMLTDNIYFSQNDEIYVGLGATLDGGRRLIGTIWKYDFSANQWLDTQFPGRPLWRAFATDEYFGGGSTGPNVFDLTQTKDFWQYKNGKYERLPDLPFQEADMVAFTLSNNLYLAGGATLGNRRQVYRYNKTESKWDLLAYFPFDISQSNIHFGDEQNYYFIDKETSEIFAFNEGTNLITKKGLYPSNLISGGGMGIILNGKAYIGLLTRRNQLFEWDLSTNTWKEKNEFPGLLASITTGVFTKNGLIYILRSPTQATGIPFEFWSFDPQGF